MRKEFDRQPNLNAEVVNRIAENIGLVFSAEKTDATGTFAPIDILDYVYAVLYSISYRKKFKELLKIDFPKLPYPEKVNEFWEFVKLGRATAGPFTRSILS
jgi:predicted helicase